MHISRRFVFMIMGLVVLSGAVSLVSVTTAASKSDGIPLLKGTWSGNGDGEYHPPGQIIYPFQSWKGEIFSDLVTFKGTWSDTSGNYGGIKGKITYTSLTTGECMGHFTWDNAPNGNMKLDKFKITFNAVTKECDGIWASKVPPYANGNIWGQKVD